MKHISELERSLSIHLDWNKSRMGCLARMVMALIAVRSVNLVDLACAWGESSAKASSHYRRLQRFFSGFQMDFDVIARFLFRLFFTADSRVYLTMDRTNWKWGQANINMLTLGIVYRGTAIPVYWQLLDKRGNSNTAERQELIRRFIRCFGKACIQGLLADREFVGCDWLSWLLEENIPFYVRIRNNMIATNTRGLPVNVSDLFSGLAAGESLVLSGLREVMGCKVYLSALRLADGELLIVATSQEGEAAIERYGLRWEIETLFGCLKSRGFRFEDTHMTKPDRIQKLMAILSIALAWAHRVGEWRNAHRDGIKVKKHGRLAKSLFRHGLDYIRELLFGGKMIRSRLKECLHQLLAFKEQHHQLTLAGVNP